MPLAVGGKVLFRLPRTCGWTDKIVPQLADAERDGRPWPPALPGVGCRIPGFAVAQAKKDTAEPRVASKPKNEWSLG